MTTPPEGKPTAAFAGATSRATKRHRPHIHWDTQPLGEVTDDALARMLDTVPSAVSRARRHRNIPAASTDKRPAPTGHAKANWLAQPLGEMTDTDLAASLDVNVATVQSHREAFGIPPFITAVKKSQHWDDIVSRLTSENVDVTAEVERAIAKELGVSPRAAAYALRRRGILTENARRKSVAKAIDWNNLDWTCSDVELAKKHGLTRDQVRYRRSTLR